MHNFERVAEIQHLLELDPDKIDGPEGLEPSPEVLAARVANIKAEFGVPLPPLEGQTCVICPPRLWKSAALFYDRVWMPPNVPEQQNLKDSVFYTATEIEVLAAWQGILDPNEKHEPGCQCGGVREYLIKQISEGIQKEAGIESTCLLIGP